MSNPWQDISKYIDKYDHIVQANGDGGDSLNRVGTYMLCCNVMNQLPVFPTNLFYLMNSGNGIQNDIMLPEGRFRRNPDSTKWYSDPKQVTRDQMTAMEAWWAVDDTQTSTARKHFLRRLVRLFFHFDIRDGGPPPAPYTYHLPDLCSPTEFCVLVRAARLWPLYPLLVILDFSVMFDILVSRNSDTWDGDNSLAPMVIACLKHFPTPFVWLAKYFYKKTNATSLIQAYYTEANGNNGIEPLGKILVQTFKQVIG